MIKSEPFELLRPVHVFRVALSLFSRRERWHYWILVLLQIFLSFLDLASVLVIAALIGLSSGLATQTSSGTTSSLLDFSRILNLQNATVEEALFTLGGIAAALLLIKTVCSIFLARLTFHFLANQQARISGNLAASFFDLPMSWARSFSSQQISFALTTGTNSLIVRTLASASTILVDSSLVVLLILGLIAFDPLISLIVLVFFSTIAVILHGFLSKLSRSNASVEAHHEVLSTIAIQEGIADYRSALVGGATDFYVRRFRKSRENAVRANAELQIVGQLPKFAFEISLVVGAALITFFQFRRYSLDEAVAGIALFLIAAGRITPALLRLQGALLNVSGSSSTAGSTLHLLRLIEDFKGFPAAAHETRHKRVQPEPIDGVSKAPISVELHHVSYRYPGAGTDALGDLSLSIPAGSTCAVIGKSGSGKTTLADLILGCLDPTKGTVLINGLAPRHCISSGLASVAYVSQDIALNNSSIIDNLTIGLDDDFIDEDRAWHVLEQVELADLFRKTDKRLNSLVGERGLELSGGQRQRIALARALYMEPSLLVLDEATSALDIQTENSMTGIFKSLQGKVTLIIIAHRLNSLLHAEQIAFLESGRLQFIGSYDHLREREPKFQEVLRLSRLESE